MRQWNKWFYGDVKLGKNIFENIRKRKFISYATKELGGQWKINECMKSVSNKMNMLLEK